VAASISVSSHSKPSSDSANLDEVDSSNLNSILLVSDNLGHIFGYLDGTFPFGFVSLDSYVGFKSMVKHPSRPYFLGHVHANEKTFLRPALIDIPLIAQRKSRDLAKLSSSARELVWYMLRVVKEMRSVWYGSESNTGARELGPKWILSLETKQKEHFGRKQMFFSSFERLMDGLTVRN
jgi:Anaphase-promoting complex, cyclosome, subunit 4